MLSLIFTTQEGVKVATIIEENNYYPFGAKHTAYNDVQTTNKYKYNGKELQDELGFNMYDFGARNYESAIRGLKKLQAKKLIILQNLL